MVVSFQHGFEVCKGRPVKFLPSGDDCRLDFFGAEFLLKVGQLVAFGRAERSVHFVRPSVENAFINGRGRPRARARLRLS